MIVCAGESLIDFVPAEEPSRGALPLYRPVPGGCPFNCAIAAARLGGAVAFAGTVSTDFFGDRIAARLAHNGVTLNYVTRLNLPTTLAFVTKASDGSARYAFFTEHAADRALSPDHLPAELPDGTMLQIGSISLIPDPEGTTLLDWAEREASRRIVALDPNIRTTLITDEAAHRERVRRAVVASALLKTSDEDLAWVYPGTSTDEGARRALADGARLVVVTRGAQGSTAFTRDRSVSVLAEPVEVADTIGAGDSFLAALLVWLDERGVTRRERLADLDDAALRSALGFAARVSAFTCTRVGADPPRRDELASGGAFSASR